METRILLISLCSCLIYMLCGVFIFIIIESNFEIQRQQAILDRVQAYLDNVSCSTRDSLLDVLDFINGDFGMAHYVLKKNSTENIMWDSYGGMSFVVTLLTTVGFGNITPKTPAGRIACMVYASFGIPLMLMCLGGIGENLREVCSRFLKTRETAAKYPHVKRRVFIVLHAVVGLFILFVVPSLMFVWTQQWGILDSIYFCFITFTTIGFGDLVAENPVKRESFSTSSGSSLFRIFIATWVLMGLSYIAMIISGIMHFYLKSTNKLEKTASKHFQGVLQNLKKCKNTRVLGKSLSDGAFSQTKKLCRATENKSLFPNREV